MNRSAALSARLSEVLLDGHWIANTNYRDQLKHTSYAQAIQKINGLNSIAALTFHINYYLIGLLPVFDGGNLEISDKFSYDLPELKSDTDWQSLVNEFLVNAQKFVARVEQLDDSLLDQPFVDEKYGSYLRNIEAVIEHSYYHLGQIVLIRKCIQNNSED